MVDSFWTLIHKAIQIVFVLLVHKGNSLHPSVQWPLRSAYSFLLFLSLSLSLSLSLLNVRLLNVIGLRYISTRFYLAFRFSCRNSIVISFQINSLCFTSIHSQYAAAFLGTSSFGQVCSVLWKDRLKIPWLFIGLHCLVY